VEGEARYLFGLPVTRGQVRYRVENSGARRARATFHAEVVAVGTASLDDKGRFRVRFVPKAGDEEDETPVSFVLKVDVTDEGGETASANRTFVLGRVTLQPRIESDRGFVLAGPEGHGSATLTVLRLDLEGKGRKGTGRYRLAKLVQPSSASAPADLPPSSNDEYGRPRPRPFTGSLPGDQMRARWETKFTADEVMAAWPDGAEIAAADVQHDENGRALVRTPALAPGAYRLHYETKDPGGAIARADKVLVVTGATAFLAVPAMLAVEQRTVPVGVTARVLVHSGFAGQTMYLDVFRGSEIRSRQRLTVGRDGSVVELPMGEADRGGLALRLIAVRDHQVMTQHERLVVPWDNKELKVGFETFRDLIRPGSREIWRVTVSTAGGRKVEAGAAEVLALMYDLSLDAFAPHELPQVLGIWPDYTDVEQFMMAGFQRGRDGVSRPQWYSGRRREDAGGKVPEFSGDSIRFGSWTLEGRRSKRMVGRAVGVMGYGGGMGRQEGLYGLASGIGGLAFGHKGESDKALDLVELGSPRRAGAPQFAPQQLPISPRRNFAETAFWMPALLTGADGSVSIEFTVPDSVTSWRVWVQAVGKALESGQASHEVRSARDLVVRPYLPRFLREGDRAALTAVVSNSTDKPLSGDVELALFDPDTNADLTPAFGIKPAELRRRFTVAVGANTSVTFPLAAPNGVRSAAVKVTARTAGLADAEQRPLPVLPGRLHLFQSRFSVLRDAASVSLAFADLGKPDPARKTDQLVVTVDAQLLQSALAALPYLVTYPYECSEQVLNRFVSTAIVSSLLRDTPGLEDLAKSMAARKTPLQPFDAQDPNRRLGLEESPWLQAAQGGPAQSDAVVANILDPANATAEREAALGKLAKAQLDNGAFPWFSGGPASPYITLYLVNGFARAVEAKAAVPLDMLDRAWRYLAAHYRTQYAGKPGREKCCWEWLTFLNYAATSFHETKGTRDGLTEEERRHILEVSLAHSRKLSPLLKGYLALTLKRMGRDVEARRIWAGVMDGARTTAELGTVLPEAAQPWLWHDDRTEAQAFALRVLAELEPDSLRGKAGGRLAELADGLMQWLLLDKRLSQWKSTRATAEAIDALVYFMGKQGTLGLAESITVKAAGTGATFDFDPAVYAGGKGRLVVPGARVDANPAAASVDIAKDSPGLAFASATWHFATDRLPSAGQGDFFTVSRRTFIRDSKASEVVLRLLSDGTPIRVGDEIEVQLIVSAKHRAEFIHLRDPCGAGFEPMQVRSGWQWDLVTPVYREIRDSGANFFIEELPAGEYTLKHRLRATMSGTFRVAPATVQSMYAPELTAYSAGATVEVRGEAPDRPPREPVR
jgi:hypothetical protein